MKPRRSPKAGESRGMEIRPPALHSTSSSSAREVEMGPGKFPCKSLGRAGNERGLLGSVSCQQGFSQASEIGSSQRLPSITARASGSMSSSGRGRLKRKTSKWYLFMAYQHNPNCRASPVACLPPGWIPFSSSFPAPHLHITFSSPFSYKIRGAVT